MMSKVINGKLIAASIQDAIKHQVASSSGRKPGLAFVLVGHHAASHAYVNMKKKGCHLTGIHSECIYLPEHVSEHELLKVIFSLNDNPLIDGILIQQPLPSHIITERIVEAIDPKKDVDGFHPLNIGKALLGQEDGFLPCTPYGIMTLLEKSHISPNGKHVVIVGRSNIVGKPLAAMLVQKKPHANATVTLAHSQTKHLDHLCKQADILIAAMGKPLLIKRHMIKEGAVVIDVGINRLQQDGSVTLVGDVDFNEVIKVCSYITPVPGGVGPMTIAMLLSNTYLSYQRSL